MRTPLVADIEDLKCYSCCRYRGSYMSATRFADIEDPT